MTARTQPDRSSEDLLRHPLSVVLWWGLPLLCGWAADFSAIPDPAHTLVWATALAWMGMGCALNAYRCRRLHCYIAAPDLLLGAALTAVLALDPTLFGSIPPSYLINGSLAVALLSFLAEPVWGKYRTRV